MLVSVVTTYIVFILAILGITLVPKPNDILSTQYSGIIALVILPLSMISSYMIAKFTTDSLGQRLEALFRASEQFANGNFIVRIHDDHDDDVGHISRQFNSMADVMLQSIHFLRDLAQSNSQMVNQAELIAVQAERGRLSRELHDSIAQHLFSLSASAHSLPQLINNDVPASIKQAARIAELAQQANLEMREILIDLRPIDVIEDGLAEALENLCNKWKQTHHIDITCTLMLLGRHINRAVEDVVYRVTQEALANVAKHANAQMVTVSVLESQTQLTVSITDDGKGFNAEKNIEGVHFGLVSMTERARAVGGTFEITSDTGKGTTVRIVMPLRTEQDELKG